MAKNIDKTGIQYRMLNTKKGPAVQAPRAQADKKWYQFEMKHTLEKEKNLLIRQDLVEEIVVNEHNIVQGVITRRKIKYLAKAPKKKLAAPVAAAEVTKVLLLTFLSIILLLSLFIYNHHINI